VGEVFREGHGGKDLRRKKTYLKILQKLVVNIYEITACKKSAERRL